MKTARYTYILCLVSMIFTSCNQEPWYTIPMTGYGGTTQVERSLAPDSFRVADVNISFSSSGLHTATVVFGGILPVAPESILFSTGATGIRGTITFYDRTTGQETYNVRQPPAGTTTPPTNPLIEYRVASPNRIDFWFVCDYQGQQLDFIIWGGENGTSAQTEPCVYATSPQTGRKHCLDQSGYYRRDAINPYQNIPAVYLSTLQNLNDAHYATISATPIQCP